MTNKFKQYCIVGASIVFIVVIFVFVLLGWEHIKECLKYLSIEWPRNVIIGIGAIVTLVIAYYRSDAMQKQAKIANRQADLAEKRYASEQFSQSVTLLAKNNEDNKPAIEARVGGIYALAKLAEADPKQYGAQVMKTLVAYICNNAQLTALSSEKDRNQSTPIPEKLSAPYPEKRLVAAHLGADIEAAFAELKRLYSNKKMRDESKVSPKDLRFSYVDFRALRLDKIKWIERPNLLRADLSGANLRFANLQGADLSRANLKDARLRSADLKGAKLQKAKLQGVNLNEANLQGADLWHGKLKGANLSGAKLQGANLRWAKLQGASLYESYLEGASLVGAELQGADLRWTSLQKTKLTKAKVIYTAFENVDFDESTKFGGSVKEWKIWHDNNEFLLEREVQSLPLDAEWDLDLIFPEVTDTSDVVFTLEGILRNFAERGNNKPGPRAIECRQAVKQWVEEHDLLEHLRYYWREWLKSLDSNGRAPDDK